MGKQTTQSRKGLFLFFYSWGKLSDLPACLVVFTKGKKKLLIILSVFTLLTCIVDSLRLWRKSSTAGPFEVHLNRDDSGNGRERHT